MTEERETECFVAHAPLGVPMILKPPQEQSNTSDHVLLVNEDYIAGKLKIEESTKSYPLFEIYTKISLIPKDSTCKKVSHYG